MNYEKLCAKQALQIDSMKTERRAMLRAMDEVVMSLVCIGGPLNDNVKGYTAEQRKDFHRIEQTLSEWSRKLHEPEDA